MSEIPFQILMVDDDPDDIKLAEIQLSKINMELEVNSVDSREAFQEYLNREPLPDLVICDYQLPEYNGEKALEFVRDLHDYLPFILVTGYLGEEEAVEIMRNGASDIITKQKLDRLGPAVQRELINFRERKEAQRDLEIAHKRFQSLVEQGGDVVVILGEEGYPEYVSPSVKNIFGYSVEEAISIKVNEITHPDDYHHVEKALKQAKKSSGENISVPPVRMKHQNGTWRWCKTSLTDLRHQPSVSGIVDNIRDIHEQVIAEKRLVQSKEQYQSLIQTIDGIVWEADVETFNFKYVSPQAKELLGYNPDEWTSTPGFWEDQIHPNDRQETVEYCQNQARQGKNHSFEYRMQKADGEYIWLKDVVTVILENGGQASLRGVMIDITQQKELELKLEQAYQLAKIGNWELDLVNEKLYWSNYVKELHEVDDDYVPNLDTAIDFYKEGWSRDTISKAVENSINRGEPFDLELQIETAKGNERWVRAVGRPEFVDDTCVRIFGSTQDITERKKAQIERRKAEEKHRNVVEHSTNMFYQHDTDGVLTYVSPQSKQFLGYPPEEARRHWAEFITDHPVNKKGEKITQRAIDTGEIQEPYELQLKTADNRIIWVEVNEAPLKKDGDVVGIVGSLTDITDRKDFEERLQESLERYEYLSKATYDAIWDWDLIEDSVYWGEGFEKLFGHKVETLAKDSSSWTEYIHADDEEWVHNSIQSVIEGTDNTWYEEYRYERADGSFAYVEDRGFIIRNECGEAERMIGAMRDVSEKKELEKLLEQAQRMARIGAWELDLETEKIYWSPITREIHETEPDFEPNLEEGINFYKKGENRETIRKAVNEAIENGTSWDVELQIVTAKGNEKWVRAIGAPEMKNGECVRLYGSFQDIHDRKAAQEKMVEALEERRRILERITEAFFAVDEDWNVTYWNSQAEEIVGVSREDLIGENLWEKFPIAKDLKFFKEYNRALKEQKTVHFEEFYPPLGKWFEAHGYPSEEGLSAFFRDITERKASEKEVKKANKKLKTAQEIAKLGYFEYNLETGDVYWSEQSYKIWEFDPKESLSLDKILNHMPPEDQEDFLEQHEKMIETGKPLNLVHRILMSDGSVKWVRVIGNLKKSSDGTPVAVEGTAQDITDKKLTELELEEAFREKEKILESIDDGFFTLNEDWTVTYWNTKAEQLLHTPKEKILGKNLWDVFDDAVDLPSYKNYHKVMNEGVTVSFEDYYEPIGRWFDVNAYPSDDGISVYFKDITHRKKNEVKIRRINERFEKVTEATNDAIWDYDVVEDQIFWGKGFQTLFGYNLDKIEPSLTFFISLIHPEDQDRIAEKIEDYMKQDGKTDWFEEYRFRRADGTYAYVMDRAVFIRDKRGRVTRVVGAMTDLTRQKEYEESLKTLNKQLEERADELAESNAELEQFAYVASHDLQEPLRMVSSFLTQLEKKYSDKLDEKALQYIDFAVDGASRMRQIILDLLNYSRLNRDQEKREATDLNDVVEEVLSLSRSRIKKTGAKITIDPLPTLDVIPGAIKQVFQNLLSNSLKYQEPGSVPNIQIEADELEEHWQFSIRDNGIGIREEFRDTIFQLFQRLHTRDQYSGTGIGLAIAKKIVERHGGEIWVESEEGRGSTFYFTLEK